MLYVFDRVTGKPIWPIEERAVEKGDVPGEWYSPTQPFPLDARGKVFAYDWNGFQRDYIIDYTPELRAEGERIVSRYKIGPVFTPPVVSKVAGPLGGVVSLKAQEVRLARHARVSDQVMNHLAENRRPLKGPVDKRPFQATRLGEARSLATRFDQHDRYGKRDSG